MAAHLGAAGWSQTWQTKAAQSNVSDTTGKREQSQTQKFPI